MIQNPAAGTGWKNLFIASNESDTINKSDPPNTSQKLALLVRPYRKIALITMIISIIAYTVTGIFKGPKDG